MGDDAPSEEREQLRVRAEDLRSILRLIEQGAESGIVPPVDMHPNYATIKKEYDELLKRLSE